MPIWCGLLIAERWESSYQLEVNRFGDIVGAGLFAFTIFIRAEPGFDEWIAILNVYEYYIGVYILIGAGALVMIFSFLGCCSALMEHSSALYLLTILLIVSKSDHNVPHWKLKYVCNEFLGTLTFPEFQHSVWSQRFPDMETHGAGAVFDCFNKPGD
uniref:Uncharacterized protein n=1 Tax=Anopheles minimus TaxID=112268 RepID=A0A182WCW4_9DIPT